MHEGAPPPSCVKHQVLREAQDEGRLQATPEVLGRPPAVPCVYLSRELVSLRVTALVRCSLGPGLEGVLASSPTPTPTALYPSLLGPSSGVILPAFLTTFSAPCTIPHPVFIALTCSLHPFLLRERQLLTHLPAEGLPDTPRPPILSALPAQD